MRGLAAAALAAALIAAGGCDLGSGGDEHRSTRHAERAGGESIGEPGSFSGREVRTAVAAIQLSRLERADDPLSGPLPGRAVRVQRFTRHLASLGTKCREGPEKLAKLTVDAKALLRSDGIYRSLLDVIARVDRSIRRSPARAECLRAFVTYVTVPRPKYADQGPRP